MLWNVIIHRPLPMCAMERLVMLSVFGYSQGDVPWHLPLWYTRRDSSVCKELLRERQKVTAHYTPPFTGPGHGDPSTNAVYSLCEGCTMYQQIVIAVLGNSIHTVRQLNISQSSPIWLRFTHLNMEKTKMCWSLKCTTVLIYDFSWLDLKYF